MNISLRRSSGISPIAAVLATAVALILSGCSLDGTQSAPTPGSADISGIIHGGPNPVVGATVKLYATTSVTAPTSSNNYGYGQAGNLLGTTATLSNGSFSFTASSYTCPAGQYAYVTSAAGNTGANSANPNSLLMAAIGPCSSLSSSTQIWIDELSTVAAAYALGNFMTISGSGSTALVNISAPANNNAAAGSCTVVSGVTTSCTAAGLAHAFLNAANLVNAVGTVTSPPTGQAYITPVTNKTTSATVAALQNVVPQQLINTLGNVIQACVNSTGGTAGGTNACATLFTNTTPSSTYTASPIVPTNTLQALVNLAKFPFIGTANLYNLVQTVGFYQPTLTAAPPDFTIAILWRSYASGANEIGPTYYTTTDINDNVYATALTDTAGTGTSSGAAPVVAQALSSDGVGVWAAPATISTVTTNVCTAYAGTALNDPPCLAATDTLGHLWVANGESSSGQGGVYTTGYLAQVSTSSGAVTQFTVPSSSDDPLGLAVDKSNDVFFSTSNVSSTNNLWELPQGSTSSTAPTAVAFGGVVYQGAHSLGGLAFDASGNLWATHNSGSGTGYIYGANNTGVLPVENFSLTAVADCNNCAGGAIGSEGTNSEPSSAVVDAGGNMWFTGNKGLYEVPAGGGGGAGTGSTAYTLGSSSQTMRLASMDGAGTIFVPDSDAGGSDNPLAPPSTVTGQVLRIFYPAFNTQLNLSISGCNIGTATGNTTCIASNAGAPNNLLFYQAFNAAIDSTGSLWVSSAGNDAVIQIIGLAAPTWPQASYLHPAAMPY